jgi:histidinol phosphatase-like enzyme
VADSMDLVRRTELLGRATAELSDVAATIDWLCDCSNPSIELIEATRAVHGALNAVGALGDSLSDVQSAFPRGRAFSSGNGDVGRRSEPRSSLSPSDSVDRFFTMNS